MGLRNTLTSAISGLVLDWPLKDKDLAEMAKTLDLAGGRLKHAFASAKDNSGNRRLLSHIVGIERWGQSRLRAAMGEPLMMDEYDGYLPSSEASWPALQKAFADTRQQTVALAQALSGAASGDVKVPHNQFGSLSVRSWLRYLDLHANLEAKKLKP